MKNKEKYTLRKAKKSLEKSIIIGNAVIADMDPQDDRYKEACEGVQSLCVARDSLNSDNLRWIMPTVASISSMLIYLYCDQHGIPLIGNIKTFFNKQKV